MAMGRWRGERQGTLFIETEKLARSEGRTFYSVLSEILSGNGFDRFCEEKVAAEKVFDEELGRPSIPPGGLLPDAARGVFRGRGVRARDRVALCRFAEPAGVSGVRADRDDTGPLDPFGTQTQAGAASAPGGLRLGA